MSSTAKVKKITLREALKKFPEECKELLGEAHVMLLGKLLAKSDWNPLGLATARDRLRIAALDFLEDKPATVSPIVWNEEQNDECWSNDSCCWLLVEVRAYMARLPERAVVSRKRKRRNPGVDE